MELVNTVPKINPEDFEEMVNSNMKVRNVQEIDCVQCILSHSTLCMQLISGFMVLLLKYSLRSVLRLDSIV